MPSNLAVVTCSRGLPFRTKGSKSWFLFGNPIRSSLHLASFSWNPSILACLERSSTASWSLLTPPFVTTLEQDVLSMYFHMSAGVSKSLIKIRNNQGPNFVPWGTSDGTDRHSEWQSWASLTLFPIHQEVDNPAFDLTPNIMLLVFEWEHYGLLGQKPYGSQVGLLLPWHHFRRC